MFRRSPSAVPSWEGGGDKFRLMVNNMSSAAAGVTELDRASIPQFPALHATRSDEMAINDVLAAAFRDHSAAVRGSALRFTRDPEIAADVTQDAFLRLVVEAQSGRLPDNVGGWLFRTSANLIFSRARHESVARRHAPALVRSDVPAKPDAIVVLREEQHEISAALATLSPADRIVLLMAARGATGQEISKRIGRSNGATRTLLCRARGRLRAAAIEGGVVAGRIDAATSARGRAAMLAATVGQRDLVGRRSLATSDASAR